MEKRQTCGGGVWVGDEGKIAGRHIQLRPGTFVAGTYLKGEKEQ